MRFGRHRLRRSRDLAVVLVAALATVGVGSAGAANQAVTVRDNEFVPSTVTVNPGESVTWTNPGPLGGTRNPHNVMFDDDSFVFPITPLEIPWQAARTFTTPGTYAYHCHEHGGPGGFGMSGVVVVTNAGVPPGSTPPRPGAPNVVPPVPLGDKSAPSVSNYAVTNKVFKAGAGSTSTSGKAAARKPPTGTTFRYSLSEAATVKIVLQQLVPGRNRGKACVRPTARLRNAKKCIRAVTQGTLTRTSHVGANRVPFSGRVGRRTLRPGSYRAVLTATDAARNVSASKTITFRVVRG